MSTVKIPEYVIDWEVYEESGISYSDFTDGGAAVGTYTCGFTLPINFYIEKLQIVDVTGFAGDTSCTLTVGDGTDADRLNTGTPSIFATATIVEMGAPSGTRPITTEFKPVLTATSGSDWGAVTAGQLTIKVIGYMVR